MNERVPPAEKMQIPPAIIFSDLDGTLLDHADYTFGPALPALRAIQQAGIPLILTTSKTLAETAEINRALGNHQAVIVENGGALCFPLDQALAFEIGAGEMLHGHAVVRLAPPHEWVRRFIERQRARHRWRLRGFGDMTNSEVVEQTGLSEAAAELARQRLCGEPFVWLDSPERFAQFRDAAADHGLGVTRGGRFHHLTGHANKADAMRRLLRATYPAYPHPVIALGDSDNDKAMLEAADVAVVIRRPDGTHLDCHGTQRTLLTRQEGPTGWNAAVLQVLDELRVHTPAT
ncbi:MAG: HAD-IIB family hydrolase [Chromatiaceae bacterium]|nr:HAD-IIB family hydrolase [Chromatiaceae bacterium]